MTVLASLQFPRRTRSDWLAGVLLWGLAPALPAGAQEEHASIYPEMPAGNPPPVEVTDAEVAAATEMRPYREVIAGTEVTFDLVPIPSGRFLLGSPAGEDDREDFEGPQVEVEVDAFWMGRCEVTWDEFELWMYKLDIERREESLPQDAWADAVSRPTPPYAPMDFEMGVDGYPAICMTQIAAKQYTRWLSMKTGRFYRLPTEAEWEYACRAGTTTAYSFGDDPEDLDDHAWHFENSDDQYQKVGQKTPNPWGLHDMHGNVAEWVLDQLMEDGYAWLKNKPILVRNPVAWPKELYPRVARGGSWDDDPEMLRSAARRGSGKSWKVQDPQLPKSIWYHTDAPFIGFRVVRPLREPAEEEKGRYWDPDLDEVREIMEKQRRGGR